MRGVLASCVGALLLAALPLSAVAELQVSLQKLDCGCDGSEGPRSREEERKVDYRWLGPEQLEVQVWGAENSEWRIDESSAWGELKESSLELGYARRVVVVDSSQPVLACLFTVRLTYVVKGLPRGRYTLHAEPAGTVQVEP